MRILLPILIGIVWVITSMPVGHAQPAVSVSEADNQLAFDLYTRLSSNTGNVFFSPYSLSSALSMTYEGARNQTADQMRVVLHFPPDDAVRRKEDSAFIGGMNRVHKLYELDTANALWAQKAYPFKNDYLKLVQGTYFAQARNLDFVADPEGSRGTINNWVSKNTNNRINDLLPAGSINPKTRLVLTNAVYFKGKWSIPFQKEGTKQDAFWISPSVSVQTAMMGLVGKSFRYMDNAQEQILELPYQGEALSMLIILPLDKDIKSIENSISESMLKQWDETMYSWPVNVYIPKFKFGAGYQMRDVLEKMGIKNAFDSDAADFSAMAYLKPNERLYIDQVYHKAWIKVNEEGTEAAAATGVVMMRSMAMMAPRQPKIFRADHPFIFLIRNNNTKHILFMGRISDPRD